jgi:hypothetical protein
LPATLKTEYAKERIKMDLKRAWRNGFLVLVIFAIPLSDLYFKRYSNQIVDNSVEHASSPRRTPSADVAYNINEDHSDVPSSWGNNPDEKNPAIPRNTLADLLFESGDTPFNDIPFDDIQQTPIPFDPQDIFLSKGAGRIDRNNFRGDRQNGNAPFGLQFAPGMGGSFSPSMFGFGGKDAGGGLRNDAGKDSHSPLIDPILDSSAQSNSNSPIGTAFDTTASGTFNAPFQNVPEPSPLVLITIGMISIAALLYRKSNSSSQLP